MTKRSAPVPGDAVASVLDADSATARFAENRQLLADDPYRPIYHFSPPGFAMHDVAGLCRWQGRYHLFYLLSIPGATWGRGHAVSDDLVHWRDLPMLPTTIRGATGQVWADTDRVILSVGGQAITASDPLLLEWTDPVMIPPGDNHLWRQDDHLYQLRTRHGRVPTLEIHRSRDGAQWESLGNYLEEGRFTEPGTDCSCPNLLPLGAGKSLLLFFAHHHGPQYFIGTSDLDQGRFAVEQHGRMNYGPVARGSLHAPSGFIDGDGRCIGIWNVFEGLVDAGFQPMQNGILSLLRRLSLPGTRTVRSCATNYPDLIPADLNPLGIAPIEELRSLRFDTVHIDNLPIRTDGETVLHGVRGKAMELEVVIDPGEAREFGLRILRSPNGEEQTTISLSMDAWAWPWSGDRRELMIDVSRASLGPQVASRSPEIGPLYLEQGEPLRLRIFIDRSIVEVFANDRQCLTLRAYPTRHDSTGVAVFARGGTAHLTSFTAHQMKSIWPELNHLAGH